MNIRTFGYAACALLAGAALAAPTGARANDDMFPPAPAAKKAIDFDGRGFIINGKRTFLASAGIEYARTPRALWRDRLMRIKRAGMNCVEVYTFWNFHEPQDGQFNFSGDADLDAFLKLAKSLGLYSIVRVGPYYCAEWDSGGYPIWLRFKPGVRVREDNAQFEKYADRFFDKLIPIVAANQVNRGGGVVLVQLENEHPQGWGTEIPNAYFKHLQSKALSLGLEVPYFFSGLHHGGDPAGDRSWDSVGRSTPWFTTEFWSVWYNKYGQSVSDAKEFDRRTWKIIAYGGNGYNYYMMHGGTNFAYWNDDEDAASYDYGTGIGQSGDLRSIYYRFKRAAWFARSFQDILENSVNADADFAHAAGSPAVKTTARRSPSGTIVFLDNPGTTPVETTVGGANGESEPPLGPVTLEPGEIAGFARDYQISPGVTITRSSARIAGIVAQGDTTTLVIHGQPGSMGQLLLKTDSPAAVAAGASDLKSSGNALTLDAKFPESGVDEYTFVVGSQRVRILAVSTARADRTWFIEAGGANYVVSGPQYVSEAQVQNGRLRLTCEEPWAPIPEAAAPMETVIYGAGSAPQHIAAKRENASHETSLSLANWETKSGSDEAQPAYNDHAWKTGAAPLQMGADGDISADAWYRCAFSVAKEGNYTVLIDSVHDRWVPYIDGAAIPTSYMDGTRANVHLTAGRHTFAALTAHDGRQKMYNYLGPLDDQSPKGLSGTAKLVEMPYAPVVLNQWRMLAAPPDAQAHVSPPAPEASGWSPYAIGQDPFHAQPGFAWLQTVIPAANGSGVRSAHFPTVDDNATVFLNGKKLAEHSGWNDPFDVALDTAWLTDSPNVLSVLVENNAGGGGMTQPAVVSSYLSAQPLTGWELRGGPGDPFSSKGWTAPLKSAAPGPRFYRANLTAKSPIGDGVTWRVITKGLSYGSVWVNGHNLGRYPEKVPINGLYIPNNWLKSGDNSLVIYDENGAAPGQVTVEAETAASRDVVTLDAKA